MMLLTSVYNELCRYWIEHPSQKRTVPVDPSLYVRLRAVRNVGAISGYLVGNGPSPTLLLVLHTAKRPHISTLPSNASPLNPTPEAP
jgi:hypothetical protein